MRRGGLRLPASLGILERIRNLNIGPLVPCITTQRSEETVRPVSALCGVFLTSPAARPVHPPRLADLQNSQRRFDVFWPTAEQIGATVLHALASHRNT
jgi:hypothetical protein